MHPKMVLISVVGFILLAMLLPHASPITLNPITLNPITLNLKRAMPEGLNIALPFNSTLLDSSNQHYTGHYYTTVQIGSPPREYSLFIDPGSDITWMSCIPCTACSTSDDIGHHLFTHYDPDWSTTSLEFRCSNRTCGIPKSLCNSTDSKCTYSVAFEDGSIDSGYFVEDLFLFKASTNRPTDSSTSLIFGCSNFRTGVWTPKTMIDGVFGLGHHSMSILSQLSSQGISSKAFSHCLRRDDGGVLVLGEILHSGITYSPLIPSGYNYNLNLRSIRVGGEIVPIASKSFSSYGVFIDMGIPISFIEENIYDPLINFLTANASLSDQLVFNRSTLCFHQNLKTHREYNWHIVDDIFPAINFNFEGGASMVVRPKDYFIWQYNNTMDALCIGFKKGHNHTVLGGDVLRDRLVTYDLVNQRLGWMDYDCSQPVNGVAHQNARSSTISTLTKSLLTSIITLVVYIFMV